MEVLQRTANRGSISTGAYEIDNSVKLECDNNEWFYRASPTEGNRRTFTFSFWIKRTGLGTVNASGVQYVAGQGQHGRMYFTNDYFGFRFDDGHDTRDITTLHRDTAAWLHVVVAVDTNQSSSSNRVKIYFNGVQTTAIDFDGGSYPDIQDQASGWFTTNYLTVGTAPFGGSYNVGDGDYDMRGYLAEFCAVDGQQLAPTDFGEFDSDSGIWKPIDVSGINFGSEGYYLNFADAADLGDDESGNGNDFTENNIAAADQATDTPTNNFCTWSPLWAESRANGTITEGATQVAWGGGAWKIARSSMAVSKGRWYWEIKGANVTGDTWNNNLFGFASVEGENGQYGPTVLLGYSTGNYYYRVANSQTGQDNWGNSGGAWSSSDTFGFALDLESSTKKFILYRNGSAVNGSGTDLVSAFQTEQFFTPYSTSYNGDTQFLNWGGYTVNTISSAASDANGYGTFEYAPPSGYYALCTKNLAEYG
jgi:hypothetical protein